MPDGNPTPEGRRLQVLRTLRDASRPLGIAEIAERLSVHPNTVRFHLETLTGNGQVERVTPDRHGPGRPPLLFRPVRRMDPVGPRRYRLLADLFVHALAAEPDGTARAVEAGRAWGRRQGEPEPGAGGTGAGGEDSVDWLVGLLADMQFAPQRRRQGGQMQIGLRNCPFLELAERNTGIVCPIHLGLMQGALQARRSPMTVQSLQPFAEPDLCLARLAPAESP